MSNSSHYCGTAPKLAWRILRPWHKLSAWFLTRKIRRQHQELEKYVRRSAYEITAWKQDIGFLDQRLDHHLTLAGVSLPVAPTESNVVSMEESGLMTSASSLKAVQ